MFDVFTGIIIVGAVFVLLYIFFIRGKVVTYTPGCDSQLMDPVSATMLLSEVDPKRYAQVNIVSVVLFEEKLRFVDFRNRFVENVIETDSDSRFLYRMDCSGFWPVWRKLPDWHPFDNFKLVKESQTFDSIQKLVSRRLTEPLSIARPPWECVFLESHCKADGTIVSGIILTMHHCMGDGFTLCHQLMRRCTPADSRHTMNHCYPFKSPAVHVKSCSVHRIFAALIKLLFLRPDASGPLRNKSPRRLEDRMLCQLTELPQGVCELKKLAAKTNMTLNDIVVAAVAIALAPTPVDVTSAIWVGLNRKSPLDRPKLREHDWGNANLGTCYMQLPKQHIDPLVVLKQVHERLAAIKTSPEPVVANCLLKVFGKLPTFVLWPFRHLLMDKMSTSISNFPGPTERVRMPGTSSEPGVGTISEVFFLVAPPFSFGPYVTIISYAGRMFLAVTASEKLFSQTELDRLVKEIPAAIDLINAEYFE